MDNLFNSKMNYMYNKRCRSLFFNLYFMHTERFSFLHVTLVVIVAILIVAGSFITGFSLHKNTAQPASILTSPKVSGNYRVWTHFFSDGSCSITVTTDSLSDVVSRYTGSWYQGGSDCFLLMPVLNGYTPPELVSDRKDAFKKYNYSAEKLLEIQARLTDLDLLEKNDVHGFFSEKTFTAIKVFQEKNKLPVTGFLDQTTVTKLQGATSDLVTPLVKTMSQITLDKYIAEKKQGADSSSVSIPQKPASMVR